MNGNTWPMIAFLCFVAASFFATLAAVAAQWGPARPEAWAIVFVAAGLALAVLPDGPWGRWRH